MSEYIRKQRIEIAKAALECLLTPETLPRVSPDNLCHAATELADGLLTSLGYTQEDWL